MFARFYAALSARVRRFQQDVLAADKRRNRYVRVVCRVLGIALLALLIGFGMLLCWGLILAGAVLGLLRGRPSAPPVRGGDVLDGQCRVVDRRVGPSRIRKEF